MSSDNKKYLDPKFLRKLRPLDQLSLDKLQELAEKSQVQKLPANSTVFRQGEKDTRTIFLLSGSVEISISWQAHKEIVKANTLEAKYPLSPGIPRKCTARAKTAVDILIVDSDLLEILIDKGNSLSGANIQVTEIELDGYDSSGWMLNFLSSEAFLRIRAEDIQKLIMNMQEVPVQKDEFIIKEGDKTEFYYIVKTGECKVSRLHNGEVSPIALYASGEGFGEEALVTGSPSTITAIMKTHGSLMKIRRKDFLKIILKPIINWINPDELIKKAKKGALVIDVRSPEEHSTGKIEGSINYTIDKLRSKIDILNTDREKILYCNDGLVSQAAAYLGAIHKFPCLVLKGGYAGYVKAGYAEAEKQQVNKYQPKSGNIFDLTDDVEPSSAEIDFSQAAQNVKTQIQSLKTNQEETIKAREQAQQEIDKLNQTALDENSQALADAEDKLELLQKEEEQHQNDMLIAEEEVKRQHDIVQNIKKEQEQAHAGLIEAFGDVLTAEQIQMLSPGAQVSDAEPSVIDDHEDEERIDIPQPAPRESAELNEDSALSDLVEQISVMRPEVTQIVDPKALRERERELEEAQQRLAEATKKFSDEQKKSEQYREEKEKAQAEVQKYLKAIAQVEKQAIEQIKKYKQLEQLHERRQKNYEEQVQKVASEAKKLAEDEVARIKKKAEDDLDKLRKQLKKTQEIAEERVSAAKRDAEQQSQALLEEKAKEANEVVKKAASEAMKKAQERGVQSAKEQSEQLKQAALAAAQEIIDKSNEQAQQTFQVIDELKSTALLESQEMFASIEDIKRKIEEEAQEQRDRLIKELESTKKEAQEFKLTAEKEARLTRQKAEEAARRTKEEAEKEAERIRNTALSDVTTLKEIFDLVRSGKLGDISANNSIPHSQDRHHSQQNNSDLRYNSTMPGYPDPRLPQQNPYGYYPPPRKRGGGIKRLILLGLIAYLAYYGYVEYHNRQVQLQMQPRNEVYAPAQPSGTGYQQLEGQLRNNANEEFEKQKLKNQ